jgi:hypothetical protein
MWPCSCICHGREANVRKGTLVYVAAALNIVLGGAACSSARGNEEAAGTAASGSGDSVIIAGCLSGTRDGRFALTAAPDPAASVAARSVAGDERETRAYVLVGGDNLQAMVGKRVEVTGTVAGREGEIEHDAAKETEQPNATGGTERPTVETKEEIEVEYRQLHVQQVKEVAGNCTLTQ